MIDWGILGQSDGKRHQKNECKVRLLWKLSLTSGLPAVAHVQLVIVPIGIKRRCPGGGGKTERDSAGGINDVLARVLRLRDI